MSNILSYFTYKAAAFALSVLATSGCTYRFANQGITLKSGVRSVAVESVFDTSQETIPHHHLWTEIQKAIAADGHLRLKPREKADAIVLIHIDSARITPSGSIVRPAADEPKKDPKTLDKPPGVDTDKGKASEFINNIKPDYRRLSVAGEIATNRNLSYAVKIDVIDLKTRAVLFSNSYSAGAEIKAQRPDGEVTKPNQYIVYHEAVSNQMRQTSTSIARKFVQDLLPRL